jgi:hypothetical protein
MGDGLGLFIDLMISLGLFALFRWAKSLRD